MGKFKAVPEIKFLLKGRPTSLIFRRSGGLWFRCGQVLAGESLFSLMRGWCSVFSRVGTVGAK